MDFGVPTDVWGKDVSVLKDKKLFLFDMDGTIYEENSLFDGAKELLGLIKENGGRYVFVTNNSSKSVEDYVNKMERLGISANRNDFFTSSQAAILYLERKFKGKKIYCQGTKSLLRELYDSGIQVTEDVEKDVDVVLVGFDTELTSEKLRKTCELLQRDIPFIATNPDLRCPVNFGFIPDCGAICNMIKAATDKSPVYIGKPERTMVDIVRSKFECSVDETVVIGDRLYTDIASGINAGVTSICVLTGEATKNDILNSDIKPTLIFDSVKDIWWVLSQFRIVSK
jgi:HAD superfamily hydrolase (TIGR01450 family)